MLDIIARKDDQWALRREVRIEQRLPQLAHVLECLRVRDRAPASGIVALSEEDALRCFCCPIIESLRDICRILGERVRRAKIERSLGLASDDHVGRPEARLPKWCTRSG